VRATATLHQAGCAGDRQEISMTIFSIKAFAFAIAATIIGAGAMSSSDASAWPLKPGVSPMPGKFNGQPQPIGQPSGGCPGGLVGCTPNTYTPGGNNWHSNHWGYGGGGLGLAIAVGAQQSDGDCYYVRRKIYTDAGVIMKRQLVCE
jgi:hypothetical protein